MKTKKKFPKNLLEKSFHEKKLQKNELFEKNHKK